MIRISRILATTFATLGKKFWRAEKNDGICYTEIYIHTNQGLEKCPYATLSNVRVSDPDSAAPVSKIFANIKDNNASDWFYVYNPKYNKNTELHFSRFDAIKRKK